jgi:hypothetical protein
MQIRPDRYILVVDFPDDGHIKLKYAAAITTQSHPMMFPNKV